MPQDMSADRHRERPLDDIEVPLSRSPARDSDHDASLGELFRRLTTDTTSLLRQEVELAKAEVRETGTRIAHAGAAVGIGAGLALAGALTLTACLVLLLGMLLGDRYWLSSLLVGGAATGIGVPMIARGIQAMSPSALVPDQTVETLRDDAEWVKQEATAFKHELTKNHHDDGNSMSSSRP